MKRIYHSGTEQDVKFFLGKEIEHTPAYGKRTIFIVGVQPIEEIEEKISDPSLVGTPIEHLYFGANMSFPNIGTNDRANWAAWENMIMYFLKQGYWCSLDFDSSCVEGLCESTLSEHRRFIPVISVKVPYARLLGYNATIKIDDIGFDRSNPGVWCHRLHDLQSSEKFTSWDEYSRDETI